MRRFTPEEIEFHTHLTTIALPLSSDTDSVIWLVDNYPMKCL